METYFKWGHAISFLPSPYDFEGPLPPVDARIKSVGSYVEAPYGLLSLSLDGEFRLGPVFSMKSPPLSCSFQLVHSPKPASCIDLLSSSDAVFFGILGGLLQRFLPRVDDRRSLSPPKVGWASKCLFSRFFLLTLTSWETDPLASPRS